MIRDGPDLRLDIHPEPTEGGTMTPATQTPPRREVALNGGATITAPRPFDATAPARPDSPFVRYLWAVTRRCLGWTFLWPFLDKTFGLGYAAPSADAWLSGGSPTRGF